jgi:cysteine desulfurase
MGTLRLSTGRHTTLAEVDAAAELIIEETKRQWADMWAEQDQEAV